jgi:hypothetical protein
MIANARSERKANHSHKLDFSGHADYLHVLVSDTVPEV